MNQYYQINCRKCKTKQPAMISQISRSKGARLICLNCQTKSRWINFQRLEELKND